MVMPSIPGAPLFALTLLYALLKLSLYSIVSKSLGCALSLSFHIRLNDLDAFTYPSCSALSLCEQPLFSMFSAIDGHSSFLGHTQDSYWFGPSPLGYYDLCWLLCVQHCFMQWLPLSRHTAQTSLGTTRFFLSIHLPHLSCMIPCSYRASTWLAALPTCMTSYEISVRQTRDLPVSWYIPHIQLPSDSISRWTPLPSAISFPLPGGFGTLTR